MCTQKISQIILTGFLVVGLACGAYAEVKESKDDATSQNANAVVRSVPKATNMTVAYPLQAEVLPPLPKAPASISDTEGITKWVAAVNAYMDAAQKYIDGATDDLNHIVEQRNMAIENANKVVAEYNAFFEKHQKK
ncbi:MAG: hypothetical protein IJ516_05315 [Phascolarctobacterium sp.]|nr:hypothetical protein [Phascolarctobacterium sp.]MBR6636538.1 hypothetical protein [Phascolarctobacterium sp.]